MLRTWLGLSPLAACLVLQLGSMAAKKDFPTVSQQPESEVVFRVGQAWHYLTRASEPDSVVVIGRIDAAPDGTQIVHIQVLGLRVSNRRLPTGVQDILPHAPISEEALRASVTTLAESEFDAAAFEDGYATWSEAYNQGEAGWFTISVAEIVEAIESAIQ